MRTGVRSHRPPHPRPAGRCLAYARRSGCRGVLAQDLAAAVQGVLDQVAGGLHLTQGMQVRGQVMRGEQGGGVVLAPDPALAVQGVLAQVTDR